MYKAVMYFYKKVPPELFGGGLMTSLLNSLFIFTFYHGTTDSKGSVIFLMQMS